MQIMILALKADNINCIYENCTKHPTPDHAILSKIIRDDFFVRRNLCLGHALRTTQFLVVLGLLFAYLLYPVKTNRQLYNHEQNRQLYNHEGNRQLYNHEENRQLYNHEENRMFSPEASGRRQFESRQKLVYGTRNATERFLNAIVTAEENQFRIKHPNKTNIIEITLIENLPEAPRGKMQNILQGTNKNIYKKHELNDKNKHLAWLRHNNHYEDNYRARGYSKKIADTGVNREGAMQSTNSVRTSEGHLAIDAPIHVRRFRALQFRR